MDSEIAAAMGDPTRRIGRYVLLDELGRGGMGVVFRAYDPTVRRMVAIKSLLPDLLPPSTDSSITTMVRFQREAETVGRLRHPSIVALHEVGSHHGKPYLVMDFVAGSDLNSHLARTRFSSRQAADVVRQIAEALAYAHGEGILHRDVKPENVLLDAEGGAYLLDFGLARDVEEVDRLTKSGIAVGTPIFMAPEALSRGGDPTSSVDIYGLGGLLYFCLASQPPYTGESLLDLMKQVAHGNPTPPSKIDPSVDAELEKIALRCLKVDPRDRYSSAGEVAAALRRYLLRDAPLEASEEATPTQGTGSVAAAFLAFCLVGLVPSLLLGVLVIRERRLVKQVQAATQKALGEAAQNAERAIAAEDEAEAALEDVREAKRSAKRASARVTQASAEAAHTKRLVTWAKSSSARQRSVALLERGEAHEGLREYGEAAALYARSLELLETPEARSGVVRLLPLLGSTKWASEQLRFLAAAWHPSGESLAVGFSDGRVALVNRSGDKILKSFRAHSEWLTCLSFGAPGELVTAGNDGAVRRWKLTSESFRKVVRHQASVSALTARFDGVVASGSLDGEIRISVPGEPNRLLARQASPVLGLAFSGTERLASCGSDGTLRLWELNTGEELKVVEAHVGGATALTATVFGESMFASGGVDQAVRVWDADLEPGPVFPLHDGVITSLSFGPRGERLAWSTHWGLTRIHDLNAKRDVALINVHKLPICAVAFSPEGDSIATASEDSTLRVLHAITGKIQASLGGQSAPKGMGVDHSGQITIVDRKNRLSRYDADGQDLPAPSHPADRSGLRLDPTGRWLMGSDVYDLTRAGSPGGIVKRPHVVRSDGAALVGGGTNRARAKVPVELKLRNGVVVQLPCQSVSRAAFDEDGWLALKENDLLYLFDPRGRGEVAFTFPDREFASKMAFSRRKDRLVRVISGGSLEFWSLKTGILSHTTEPSASGLNSLALDATRNRVATGHDDGSVRLYNLETGELDQVIWTHNGAVLSVAFHSGTLVTCGEDKRIRVRTIGAPGKGSRVGLEGKLGTYSTKLAAGPQGLVAIDQSSRDLLCLAWDAKGAQPREPGSWTVVSRLKNVNDSSNPLLSLDGQLLAYQARDKKGAVVRVFPFTRPGRSYPLGGKTKPLVFGRDGKLLLAQVRSGRGLQYWVIDVRSGKKWQQRSLVETGLRFLPNGDLLSQARIGTESSFMVTSTASGKVLRTWKSFQDRVSVPTEIVRGNFATYLTSGEVRLWDLRAGKQRLILREPDHKPGWSIRLALSPDGRFLATSGDTSGKINLWDVNTGRRRIGLSRMSRVLLFGSKSRTLYSFHEKGGLSSWNLGSLLQGPASLVEQVWKRTGLVAFGLEAVLVERGIEVVRRGGQARGRWLPD